MIEAIILLLLALFFLIYTFGYVHDFIDWCIGRRNGRKKDTNE